MQSALWQSRQELQTHQLDRLRELLRIANSSSFWSRRFHEADLTADSCWQLADLQKLPLLTKADLVADQATSEFGSLLTLPVQNYTRLHQTSGTTTGKPLRWLDTPRNWQWILRCWHQIYELIQLRCDDRLCFPFSFGPFLGFWAGFEGAVSQGRLCVPAGGMTSEGRLKLINDLGITFLGCTPTYALRLADVARSNGIDLAKSSVRAILVAGEPGGAVGPIRERIESSWGARVFDHWGMTEIGPLATECEDDPGVLTVLETECIAEIIDSDSGQPVAEGKPGELVITPLGRVDSPVFRYRTGDIVEPIAQPHPSGRVLLRLQGGIRGRSDDMLIIRGNNVFPAAIEAVVREFTEVVEFRMVVSAQREMMDLRLEVELPPTSEPADLAERLRGRIKQQLNFQPTVVVVPPESLPRFEMKSRRLVRES